MHAVGHRPDRHVRGVEARPQPGEHLPAHRAVQLAHAVDALRQPHAHDGHVEHARVAAGEGLGAERQHPVHRQRGLRLRAAELSPDQVHGEPVDAGRDRGVRGEHGACPAQLQRLVEVEPALEVLPDPLDAQESRVSLVGMEHLGLGMPGDGAVGPHRPHPADAQQQFLAQPVVAAAAVEPVGHLAQVRVVLLDVGVEQQQRHPADLRDPDLRGEHRAVGQADPDPHGRAVGASQQRQRQAVRVAGRIALGLPALGRQRLGEVAVPVQQADADQRHTQVTGGLEVVAGQDAEAARVLRQRRGDAELGREVRDRRLARRSAGRRRPPDTTAGRSGSRAGRRRRR